MKKFIKRFFTGLFVSLFFLTYLLTGANCRPVIPAASDSMPYAVIQSIADPFILPDHSGGDPYQTDFLRIRLPVIEWKSPVENVLLTKYSPFTPVEFFPIRGFQVEPVFMAIKFLRL